MKFVFNAHGDYRSRLVRTAAYLLVRRITEPFVPHGSGTVKKSGPWIPSVTVGVRKWLITNPDREGGDVKSNGQIDFFTVPNAAG